MRRVGKEGKREGKFLIKEQQRGRKREKKGREGQKKKKLKGQGKEGKNEKGGEKEVNSLCGLVTRYQSGLQ